MVANRGLAGIDGVGLDARSAPRSAGRTAPAALALLGDVTFLHDANGLVLGPDEARPDLTIVVVNDDGGSIFAIARAGRARSTPTATTRLFGTPHGVDLASLCAATRTPHWRVDSLAELEHALASPNGGIEVVEAVVRRDNRRDLDAADPGAAAAETGRIADDGSKPRPGRRRPARQRMTISMTVAADTFAEFVDHLAEALDDPRRPRGDRRGAGPPGCTSRASTSTG